MAIIATNGHSGNGADNNGKTRRISACIFLADFYADCTLAINV
jgi:hypothetical protein